MFECWKRKLVFMSEIQPYLVWKGLNSTALQNFLQIVGLFRVSTPSIYVGCKIETAGRIAASKPNTLQVKLNKKCNRCCRCSIFVRRKEKDILTKEKLDKHSARHIRNMRYASHWTLCCQVPFYNSFKIEIYLKHVNVNFQQRCQDCVCV